MRGDLYNDWQTIGDSFPPSLNTENDSAMLQNFESPACHGVDMTKQGRLKTGSIPSGSARVVTQKTIGATVYDWYYDRLWLANGTNLRWGMPKMDTQYYGQSPSQLESDATIVTLAPIGGGDLMIGTATGSYVLNQANDNRGYFALSNFNEDFKVTDSARLALIDTIAYTSNAKGVFAWNGKQSEELTANVRSNITLFANKTLTADVEKRYIIGASSFAIDVINKKLFDYGTSGFLWTSKTLAQDKSAYRPFQIDKIALTIEHASTSPTKKIVWQTKSEDNDWFNEEDIVVKYQSNNYSRIEVLVGNPIKNIHKFAMRISSLDANLHIINVAVHTANYAIGAVSE